ncbi:DUF6792 domain-containing protein [Alkalihalophilus lindianensis]|uniref:DUF6792 domain-containing protein n=1 Tax=Alkalihalophilus lindianensis TaxID=1630542 RepID=A0ABU3XFP7_9BACI|nr:DUF6792 domain-containing protein [Alkalihalophilus lindianensis]MDV2686103.1 DUF6792 domain-containing protein [Alkalihalophilus lindianensis]
MSKPIIDNQTRNYLTELQYTDGFTVDDVKSIIKEQMDFDLNEVNLKIYHSNEMGIGNESGFDGSAIHLYNKEENINEVYYIFRGTAKFEDIYYNATGIATASNNEQIIDAEEFFDTVQVQVPKGGQNLYGDGHSLGGHLVTSLALKTKAFSDARGLNDAPINVYQMGRYDLDFAEFLRVHTGEVAPHNIKEETIIALARDFYKEQSKVISHTRVKGDPLYAQSFPGKLYIGQQIHYVGDLDIMDFPNIGEYPLTHLAKYSPIHYLDKLRYESNVSALFWMIRETDQRVGMEGVQYTMTNWKEVLSQSAKRPEGRFALFVRAHELKNRASSVLQSPGTWYQAYDVWSNFDLVHNHSLSTLIDYYNAQMHEKLTLFQVQDAISGKYVMLNKSDLKEFSLRYEHAIEQKYQILQDLRAFIHQELDDLYDSVKRDLQTKMQALEASPGSLVSTPKRSYSGGVLGGSLSEFRTVERVEFDRYFEPIDESMTNPINDVIVQVENEINHLETFLSSFQATYNEMFDTDQSIASSIGIHAR